jgi:heme exporter protein D
MEVLISFLAMGGYAAYVWPAFMATALVLGALLLASLRSLHASEATLAALQAGTPRVREAAATAETYKSVQKAAHET